MPRCGFYQRSRRSKLLFIYVLAGALGGQAIERADEVSSGASSPFSADEHGSDSGPLHSAVPIAWLGE